MIRIRSLVALTVLLLGTACSSPDRWDGEVRSFGAMRQVLGGGQTEGRVRLAEFSGVEGAFGLGALAGLSGEVTVVDGQVWISRVIDGRAQTRVLEGADPTEATLFVSARVPRWKEIPIVETVSFEDLDAYLGDQASKNGLDRSRPFPFVIKGRFRSVHAHVINGMCPMQAEPSSEKAPLRLEIDATKGTLVGIYAEDREGELTHHGARSHVHVVLKEGEPTMGHLESVDVAAGSLLLLPR